MNCYIGFIEIPVLNMERAMAFYRQLCQTSLETVTINGEQMAFFPRAEKGASMALILSPFSTPSSSGARIYLEGFVDLDNTLCQVIEAGGKIVIPKTNISDQHYYSVFEDTEGNHIGLFSTC